MLIQAVRRDLSGTFTAACTNTDAREESTGGSSEPECVQTRGKGRRTDQHGLHPCLPPLPAWHRGHPSDQGVYSKPKPGRVIATHSDKQLHSASVSVYSLLSLLRREPLLPILLGATLHYWPVNRDSPDASTPRQPPFKPSALIYKRHVP